MALTFDYKVRDRSGQLIEGKLEGDSLPLVVGRLREMGYLPVTVTPAAGPGLKTEIVIPGFTDRIKPKEVAVFSRQFATMVDSGLSISRSLAVLATQTENKYLAQKIHQIRDDVESGLALSAALAKHPKVFDHLYVSMIRAGEIGGSIDTVLKNTANQLEKQVELNRKVRGAMTYPHRGRRGHRDHLHRDDDGGGAGVQEAVQDPGRAASPSDADHHQDLQRAAELGAVSWSWRSWWRASSGSVGGSRPNRGG